jgi:peptidoglycan-N-acetylglucosamine deacetylase
MIRLLLFLLFLPCALCAQTISFTFDDGFDPRKEPEAARLNRELLAGLARHCVESMFFPAGRNVDTEAGLALVADWSRAGHAIDNHTFGHRSFGAKGMTLAEFVGEVEAADRMFRALPNWTPRLRFPYLKEGDTSAKRDGFRAWMAEHGYSPAPVSIDTSDWYYNQRYQTLLKAGRGALVPALRKAYLAHLRDRAAYYDGLARAVLSRSPAHVMLLHTNALNAALAGDIVEMFKSLGWTVVSPAAAFADPLYRQEPQTLPAGESLLWALAREAGVKELRYPAEDGEYEKPLLDGLGL